MKFNVGDYFKVKASGITGTVIGIRTDIVAGKHAIEYYKVQWDHFSRAQEYEVDDVDSTDIWELIGGTVMVQSPQAVNFIPIDIDLADPVEWPRYKQMASSSPECNHEWTQYNGFRETYQYCKKCDQKRE